MNTARMYSNGNTDSVQMSPLRLLTNSDLADSQTVFRQMFATGDLREKLGSHEAEFVSRAKNTRSNPLLRLKTFARAMCAGGYAVEDFLAILKHLECFARALWGNPCTSYDAIVEASKREQEAEGT